MTDRLDPTDNTTPRLVARLERASIDLASATTRVPAAVRRLTDAQPGYPSEPSTTSSSQRAKTDGDEPAGPSTQPERYEALTRDDALRDLAELDKLAAILERTARRARDITSKWGTTLVGVRVADPADFMWCTSCLRVKFFSPRRTEGGTVCRWCSTTLRSLNVVRSEHGLSPLNEVPVAAVQLYAQGGRATAREVERWAQMPAGTPTRRRHARKGA